MSVNNLTPLKSLTTKSKEILLDWDKTQLAASFIIIAILAVTPIFVKQPYILGVLILTVIYAFVGITWNIVAGFAGQLLIAHC